MSLISLVDKYCIDNQSLIDMYRYHSPSIQLFDDVLDIIKSIKAKHGKIGIITDGRTKTQMAKIKALGIYDLIDNIVISEEIGTEKPNEANFKAIETSIIGNNYWYIADNLKKDFISSNKLGWDSIGLVDNGKNIHYEASKYMNATNKPKHFILSYKELNII